MSEPVCDALRALPGVEVVRAIRPGVITPRCVEPLDVRRVRVDDLSDLTRPPKATLLLVAGVLSDTAAIRLEDLCLGYVDAAGRAWLPGVPRHPRARGKVASRSASAKALQVLADRPNEDWTEQRLADAAGVSQPTTNRVLRQLRSQHLVVREGRGRASVTRVTDIRSLRRLLLQSAGRSWASLPCFVRDASALPAEFDGARLVRTGARGAQLLGIPVLSDVARELVRVPVAGDALDDFAADLGARRVRGGANLVLVADPDHAGELGARLKEERWVAGPARVAADLLFEPRGNAAADLFLDLWADRIV